MLIFALLAFSALAAFIFSLLVMRAPNKNRLKTYIAVYTATVSVWAIGDAMMLYIKNSAWVRMGAILFYVGPMITALFILFFASSSPLGRPPGKKLVAISSAIMIVLGGLIALDLNFLVQSIQIYHHSRNIIKPRQVPLIIYAAYFYIYFVLAYALLIKRYRQSSGVYKKQLLYILVGIAVSSALAVTTNLTLPLQGVYDKVWMGPIFTLFFCALLTFTIVKHGYLDIKAFAARATAYTLVIAVLTSLYAAVYSLITQTLFINHRLSLAQQLLSISLALVLATTFAPLKRTFDKTTNRIFFRDRYDPQIFLNDLGDIMTGEIELEPLTSKVVYEISYQMKLSKALIIVLDGNEIFYEANIEAIKNQKIEMDELIPLGKDIVDKDNLEPGTAPEVFEKYGLGISVGLMSSNELVGYLLLGEKMSGGNFTSSDIKTLRILAKALAVAIHNAKSYTQIQNFNKTLQKRIDDATARLRDANQHLKKLDNIKNEFLSMATHQLNTPLSVIDGYLSMIIDTANTNDNLPTQDREFIQKALHRVHLMKRLVTDFLNVSRIETGTFAIESTPVDLNRVVIEEVNTLGLAAKERGVQLHYHPPKHPVPVIEIDEEKTRQAVMNLIDNAIFYSPRGTVQVFLESDSKNITFKVQDNGIGVPENQKSRLFQKFSRADNAMKQRPSGTGVGLYLVKRVVEDQGGSIIFESTLGKGSTFGFNLPIKNKDEEAPKTAEPELTSSVA